MRLPVWLTHWTRRDLVLVPYFVSMAGVVFDMKDIAGVPPTYLFLGVNTATLVWMVRATVQAAERSRKSDRQLTKADKRLKRESKRLDTALARAEALAALRLSRRLSWRERITGRTRVVD